MCDLSGEAIKTYKLAQLYDIGESQQIVLVNEYEVCFANSMHYFDLRTGRTYWPWTKGSVSGKIRTYNCSQTEFNHVT
jgi:hypothetical protein